MRGTTTAPGPGRRSRDGSERPPAMGRSSAPAGGSRPGTVTDGASEVRIPASAGGVAGAAEALRRFSAAHALPDGAAWPFQVALDEVLSNVVRFGHGGDAPDHVIEVRLVLEQGVFTLSIVDDGPPFDPLAAPAPDVALPLDTRPVGGLGIHVIRKLMDAVAYERRGG